MALIGNRNVGQLPCVVFFQAPSQLATAELEASPGDGAEREFEFEQIASQRPPRLPGYYASMTASWLQGHVLRERLLAISGNLLPLSLLQLAGFLGATLERVPCFNA